MSTTRDTALKSLIIKSIIVRKDDDAHIVAKETGEQFTIEVEFAEMHVLQRDNRRSQLAEVDSGAYGLR